MSPPKTKPSAKKPAKAAAGPPFVPDSVAVAAYTGKRSVTGSSTGVTVDDTARPDAEVEITYRVQFRFYRFWQPRVATPAWYGVGEPTDLAERVNKSPTGDVVLEAGDRLCQLDLKEQKSVRVGKQSLVLHLGESEKRGLPYWFPTAGKLPPEVKVDQAGWKWRSPVKQPGSSPDNQWGLRGDFAFRTKPGDPAGTGRQYKMVTVWQRWKSDKKDYTADMCTLAPGTYAGYVRVMGNHQDKQGRTDYPAIWVGYTWNAGTSAWDLGVLGWILKNPNSTKLTTSIFIHPGNFPNWFLGCIGPGPVDKQTEWGFASLGDTRDTMWEILDAVGVKKSDYINTEQYVSPDKKHKKWFLIRVNAGSTTVTSPDGWRDHPVWVNP